ncbi:MAG: hypothetical protein MSG64_12170 [Pyrinomonadaceae bacterium MAG19_C2-C3]|nr:hypothetical protein [Pyrinomonadaceae bacterium MAG19_C2-C3]
MHSLPSSTHLYLYPHKHTRTAPRDNAQKDSLLVEVKDDRFTGKRTVRMLPVKVTGNLQMALSGEINTARKPD